MQALYNYLYDDLVDSCYDSSSSIGADPAFHLMYLTLAPGPFSLTTLSEDNPIDMLNFTANVGGFWGKCMSSSSPAQLCRRRITLPGATLDANTTHCPGFSTSTLAIRCLLRVLASLEILLPAWGIILIASHNGTTPIQKTRHFCKAIRRGVQRNHRPVAVEGPSPSSAVASRAARDGEEHLNEGICQEVLVMPAATISEIGHRWMKAPCEQLVRVAGETRACLYLRHCTSVVIALVRYKQQASPGRFKCHRSFNNRLCKRLGVSFRRMGYTCPPS